MWLSLRKFTDLSLLFLNVLVHKCGRSLKSDVLRNLPIFAQMFIVLLFRFVKQETVLSPVLFKVLHVCRVECVDREIG